MGMESVPCLFSIFDDISDLTESSLRGNGITNGGPFRAFGSCWRVEDLAGGSSAGKRGGVIFCARPTHSM